MGQKWDRNDNLPKLNYCIQELLNLVMLSNGFDPQQDYQMLSPNVWILPIFSYYIKNECSLL